MNAIYDQALEYVQLGLSVIPIRPDGTKAPAVKSWKPYQESIADNRTLKQWFTPEVGVAIITGEVSGNLEVLDFDDEDAFDQWVDVFIKLDNRAFKEKKLLAVSTPGNGFHFIYRCPDGIERARKLAQRRIKTSDGKFQTKTLIETRGEGNYIVAPGSPNECHPTCQPYTLRLGSFDEIPILTKEDRAFLIGIAEGLNEYVPDKLIVKPTQKRKDGNLRNRPGDHFNEKATWKDVLDVHGWEKVYESNDIKYWRRPGKTGPGISATTNYAGTDFLYVFSSNALPLEGWKAYTKFSAFTYLNHDGDFSIAAKELARQGYGNAQTESLDRVALINGTDNVLPFPLEVFPKLLRKFIEETTTSLTCPPDFIAVPMLTVLGTAIGTARTIAVKSDWHEAPIIWTATIGDPGSKKSPALSKATSPLNKIQNGFSRELFEASQRIKASNEKTPVLQQIFITDSTIEALVDVLHDNPRGIVYKSDELRAWVSSMNQYKGGKGSDRHIWLSLWSGENIIVNRRNRKTALYIPDPFVGVCGGIQPDILSDLNDERARQDGFVHRILFSYPDAIPSKWDETEVSHKTVFPYIFTVRELLKLKLNMVDGKEDSPIPIPFSSKGKSAWIRWINTHHQEVNDPNLQPALRGPWAKFEAYCARFALILQETRKKCGETRYEEVDEISVEGATKLVNYFKSHAKRVYPKFHSTHEDRQIDQILDWIRKKGGVSTVRDIQTNKVGGIKKASEIKTRFVEMQDRGLGSIEEVPAKRGGRKTIQFRLKSV